MKQPSVIAKVAAITSSVLLIGGFVSYRAGAFDRFITSPSPVGEQVEGSAPADSGIPESGTADKVKLVELDVMGGSKSGIFIVPGKVAPPEEKPAPKSRPVMGGSKSLAPVFPPPANSPTPMPPK